MKVTWLGQAGLLFENERVKIMIDPYFSNSAAEINPQNYRRAELDECFFDVKTDIMIFTHNHIDHYDKKTAERFISDKTEITVLSPRSVWEEVRKFGGNNNYILFNRRTSVTEKGIRFTAVRAEHSDENAIGVIMEEDGKKYYITGDTLYNEEIFADIPNDIFALFLPINGVGNNMNATDAKRFIDIVKPKRAVPLHFGMFDEIKPSGFDIVPQIYKEIKLQ